MKFIHLSDLRIGKIVNEFSMLNDQQYILEQILGIIKTEAPDAVIIAGDVYDRSLPPSEAVKELDEFIFKLSEENFNTFIISGNHDSAERLAFGSRIMSKNGIHISPVYNGKVEPVTMTDEFGEVNIYLLPFIKPFHVKNFFPEKADEIKSSYTYALKIAIENMNVDTSKRNIIVSHQFVTGAKTSESEVSVGGSDNVDCDVYEPFDYTALGHIHSPQSISGLEHIRYCGTPLKYSFSEDKDKFITVVEMYEKGTPVTVREIPLKPLHNMRIIEGSFEEVRSNGSSDPNNNDYVRVDLTDKTDVPNAMQRLRNVYPNIMGLRYLREKRTSQSNSSKTVNVKEKTPLELFGDFFKNITGEELDNKKLEYMKALIERIEDREDATD